MNSPFMTRKLYDFHKLTSVTWSNGLVNYSKEYAYHYSGRPTSITYKTNGITQATETMTWDKESRMLTNSRANASYAYNGFDARISKTVGGTTTTFKRASANPVSPVLSDTTSGTTTGYLPGISSRVSGTSTFSHSGIKNGVLQTNSSQTNTATKRYDAFGNELATSGTWNTRFDYGGAFGYQRDDDTGYKLLGHRYYDPEIGRFLTRDPVKDGRNWYAYCENDPVTAGDPGGLRVTWIYKAYDWFTDEFLKNGLTRRKDKREGELSRKHERKIRLEIQAEYHDDLPDTSRKYNPEAAAHEYKLNMTEPGPLNRENYVRRKGGGKAGLMLVISILSLDPIGAGEAFADVMDPVADDGRRSFDGMRRSQTGMDDDELEELTGYRGVR